MHRAVLVAAAAFLLLLRSVDAQEVRTWHDARCTRRIRATVVAREDGTVVLRRESDGRVFKIAFEQLSNSDRIFLSPVSLVKEAAANLSRSPYKSVWISLDDVCGQMASMDIIEPAEAQQIIHSLDRSFADRSFTEIAGRWIAIEGLQYKVLSAQLAPSGRGLSQIVILDPAGRPHAVTPDDFLDCRPIEITLLPASWGKSTYPVSHASLRLSSIRGLRGPRVMSSVTPEHEWKYRLVFDAHAGLWTDPATARAHQLLADAEEAWRSSTALSLADEGDYLVFHQHFEQAIDSYDRAVESLREDSPRTPLVYLRRGYAKLRLKRFDDAIADFDTVVDIQSPSHTPCPYFSAELNAAYELRARAKSSLAKLISAHVDGTGKEWQNQTHVAMHWHKQAIEDAMFLVAVDYRDDLEFLAPRIYDALPHIRSRQASGLRNRAHALGLSAPKSEYSNLSSELRMEGILDLTYRVISLRETAMHWITANATSPGRYIWRGENDQAGDKARVEFARRVPPDTSAFGKARNYGAEAIQIASAGNELAAAAASLISEDLKPHFKNSAIDPLILQQTGLRDLLPQIDAVRLRFLEDLFWNEYRYSVLLQETGSYLEGLEHATRAAEISAILKKAGVQPFKNDGAN